MLYVYGHFFPKEFAHNLQKTLAMGSKAGAEEILQTLLIIRTQLAKYALLTFEAKFGSNQPQKYVIFSSKTPLNL
jgi:hypothetical protein